MKKRGDLAFGIHFDFHSSETEIIGEIFNPEVTQSLLDRVKPDFVQCDTKGFYGISSYPTKVGARPKKINADVLKTWRDLTKERDIKLYAHHSGLHDIQVAKNHPDWAVEDENGNVSECFISVFSPYVDEVLIPQLIELAIDYDMDGAWVDGDCYFLQVDYSKYARQKYKEETGKELPKRGKPDYNEYRDFCRKGFLDYVSHYISEVKKVKPDFEITSNWIFSAFMPEKQSIDLDYLSGDYDASNAVESARYNGRCIAARGVTWDLLSWGQHAIPFDWYAVNRTTKGVVQYCQEASEILSLGGTYQFFNIMYGSGGTVQEWAIPIWEKVACFVRERQGICFKTEEVPEIAVLLPNEKNDSSSDFLYDRDYKSIVSLKSWINALQNTQNSSSVLLECRITEKINEYKVIVVPNTDELSDQTLEILKSYVYNGGKLILDLEAQKYFQDITKIDCSLEKKLIYIDDTTALASLETNCFKTEKISVETGKYYDSNIYAEKSYTASFITEYGQGCILSMCFDFSKSYENNVSYVIEQFLKNQLQKIGFNAIVKCDNPFVDIITRRKDEKLIVNLINFAGNHNIPKVRNYNFIPPLCDINIEIEFSAQPKKVVIYPKEKSLDYQYKDGKIFFKVEKLDIHSAVVIE